MPRTIGACLQCGELRPIVSHGRCNKCRMTPPKSGWEQNSDYDRIMQKQQRKDLNALLKIHDGVQECTVLMDEEKELFLTVVRRHLEEWTRTLPAPEPLEVLTYWSDDAERGSDPLADSKVQNSEHEIA